MSKSALFVGASAFLSGALLVAPAVCGGGPTKEQCVDAFGKGQDARQAGQLVEAGKLFFACAQSACPGLVQSDCARFADELDKLIPSLTFVARDGAQRDLPDTSVFVDGTLVTSHLGEGKAYEVDPGAHQIRFVHAGKETVVQVVVNQGEKGRGISGTFPSPAAPPLAHPPAQSRVAPSSPVHEGPGKKRSGWPLVAASAGAATAVAGGVLLGVGLAKVPSRCDVWSSECAAPPGDPVFDQASRSVTLANLGGVLGGVGVLTLAGSLIWYFGQAPHLATPASAMLVPWVDPHGASITFATSW